MSDITYTMAWLMVLGRMCRSSTRDRLRPPPSAAATQSWLTATRAALRVVRAYTTQSVSANAM